MAIELSRTRFSKFFLYWCRYLWITYSMSFSFRNGFLSSFEVETDVIWDYYEIMVFNRESEFLSFFQINFDEIINNNGFTPLFSLLRVCLRIDNPQSLALIALVVIHFWVNSIFFLLLTPWLFRLLRWKFFLDYAWYRKEVIELYWKR